MPHVLLTCRSNECLGIPASKHRCQMCWGRTNHAILRCSPRARLARSRIPWGQYTVRMGLNAFAAELKRQIHENLSAASPPPLGEFDEAEFRELCDFGAPQMGATLFEPGAFLFEFIYTNAPGGPRVFGVRVPSPERIVFLPVPSWVVEEIWQGEIDGRFEFYSEAVALVEALRRELDEAANAKWFGPRPPKRRE